MFNKDFFINLIKIIILALLQVFVFNHINFLGSYQPYIYIIFVLFYPPSQNKYALLILSFLLGLTIDCHEREIRTCRKMEKAVKNNDESLNYILNNEKPK